MKLPEEEAYSKNKFARPTTLLTVHSRGPLMMQGSNGLLGCLNDSTPPLRALTPLRTGVAAASMSTPPLRDPMPPRTGVAEDDEGLADLLGNIVVLPEVHVVVDRLRVVAAKHLTDEEDGDRKIERSEEGEGGEGRQKEHASGGQYDGIDFPARTMHPPCGPSVRVDTPTKLQQGSHFGLMSPPCCSCTHALRDDDGLFLVADGRLKVL